MHADHFEFKESAMEIKTYKKGDIIFRQGDPGDCLYDIHWGTVGVYANYGMPNEKLLAELEGDDFFGEMGLLEKEPRSATVVVLEKNTQIVKVTEDDFMSFFAERPDKALKIMIQLSERLRKTTKDYLEACRVVYESVEAEKNGEEKSSWLKETIDEICAVYKDYNFFFHDWDRFM